MTIRNKETMRRARMVLAWLEAHPEGGTSRQLHAASDHGRSYNTTQLLLQMMVRDGMPLVTISGGAHMRYAAARHQATAQAYYDAMRSARATRWSREVELRNEKEARERGELPPVEDDDQPRQRVVRDWSRPVKTAPNSVFELGAAT